MASVLRGAALRTTPFGSARPVARTPLLVLANKKVQKRTKVILIKDVPGVGPEGEIIVVPVGYWRNFLMPNHVAKIAGASVLGAIQAKKDEALRAVLEEKAQAQAFANALATIGKFIIKKKVGDKDQVYGSVAVSEVAEAIYQQTGRNVADGEFTVPEIKTIGTYECTLRLHPEVVATFSIVVQREKNVVLKVSTASLKKVKK